MKIELILPNDVDAFDIFCYRREGSLISVPTIHIDKNTGVVEIIRKNGIYYAINSSKREKKLEGEFK